MILVSIQGDAEVVKEPVKELFPASTRVEVEESPFLSTFKEYVEADEFNDLKRE